MPGKDLCIPEWYTNAENELGLRTGSPTAEMSDDSFAMPSWVSSFFSMLLTGLCKLNCWINSYVNIFTLLLLDILKTLRFFMENFWGYLILRISWRACQNWRLFSIMERIQRSARWGSEKLLLISLIGRYIFLFSSLGPAFTSIRKFNAMSSFYHLFDHGALKWVVSCDFNDMSIYWKFLEINNPCLTTF